MANTNIEIPTVALEASVKDGGEAQPGVKLNGEDLSGIQKNSGGNSTSNDSTEKRTGLVAGESKRTSSTTRPTLVQLGSSSTTAPQPKRFSAVNINKKFLEKNSPASAPSPSSQLTPLANSNAGATRPQVQTTISHSRLVTAKLTSISPASSASAGWSRPSSAAPPNVPGSHSPAENSPRSANVSLGSSTNVPGAPQLPHVGKVIQPQPKSAITASKLSSDKAIGEKSGKGVWGNVKMNIPAISNPLSDFPTAAEVAQGVALSKSNRQPEGRSTAEAAPPTNQAEADTFRGVHLDPNAHHWDEMEEDDDNFLDGVIEFGDGRQYKIEATETQDAALKPEDSRSNPDSSGGAGDSASIRKEDRFVDDFDRSWPRSRPPPHPTREVSTSSAWSTGSGNKGQSSNHTHEGHSPTDAPRVLFNERSNRLEPYANSHRPHRTSFHDRDSAVSPSELRSPRDAPWGSRNAAPGQNEPSSRFGNRRFSSTSSTGSGSYGRDRDYTPTSPRIFKEPLSRDRESRGERSRRSDMGPPPVPPHAFKGDNRRQLPPHMSPVAPQQPLSAEHPSPRESRFQSSKPPGADPSYRSPLPPPSPALSHTSAAKLSPTVPTHILPSEVTPQLETVQKDYMHTAAERAKERRLQEEAERERERERAKQKAAELEARMKAAAAPTEPTNKEAASTQEKPSTQESEAVAFLEDAVKPVSTPEWGSSQRHKSRPLQRVNPPTQEHSKLPDAAQPTHSSLPSKPNATQSHPFARSVSSEARSWRTSATRPPAQNQASSDAKAPELSSNTAMDRVETLVSTSGTDLEVVDFSDMGKFLDGPDESAPASRLSEKRPSRALASDFFEDVKEVKVDKPPSTDEAETSWRSNKPVEISSSTIPEAGKPNSSPDAHPPSASARTTTFANDHHHPSQAKFQRSTAPYKVAPMSALDDAMSRIKGALDGMHTASSETAAKPGPSKGRWVPPALRPRDHEMTETFSNTLDSLPISPLPLGSFKVSLPKTSKSLKPVDRRQLILFSKPAYLRWDVLSFDPPVEGMNKRDFTLNSLLFRKPMSTAKGPIRYRVNLPRRNTRAYSLSQGGKNGSNTFGRPAADGAISWRKSKDSSTGADSQEQSLPSVPEDDLCEPPAPASQPKPEPSVQFIRPRPLPKMPEGSGVAFYKDSHIDTAKDSKPSVTFFVASELESPSGSRPETPVSAQKTEVLAASKAEEPAEEPVENPLEKGSPRKVSSADNTIASWPPENTQSSGKPNHKGASISADSTPLKSRASWSRSSKDSSSRGPDPELLKAVWSQTSNKPGSHGVNSLEGIADDLTLPFTISEVKSEDGETPPPMASGPPSRMSLHEVTRAFQQPTTSSASSPRRSPPQVTNGSQQRSSNASFSYQPPPQPQPNNFRPGYPYPSPMMSHSPAPNMMYPAPMPSSPMPSRMQINGNNPPVYGQPMWMAPPGHQQPNGMMRPPVPNSPYHGPLVYPPSGPYAPGNLHPPAGQPTGQVTRDRNMPMVSPVMGHAGPAMYGSPVMMHAPMVPQNSGFIMPPAANHGPQRSENHQSIHQRGHAQPNSSLNYTQYERSGW